MSTRVPQYCNINVNVTDSANTKLQAQKSNLFKSILLTKIMGKLSPFKNSYFTMSPQKKFFCAPFFFLSYFCAGEYYYGKVASARLWGQIEIYVGTSPDPL